MITPIEIRQHTFRKTLRGFDKEEVMNFLSSLSIEWERVLEDFKRTKTELDKTNAEFSRVKEIESAIHETLFQAKETTKAKLENAQQEAELKVQEAEVNAKGIIKKAFDDRNRVEMQINELINRRNEILQQLKTYLQAQSERLQTFEQREMRSGEVADAYVPNEESVSIQEEDSFFEKKVALTSDSSIINDIADEL